MCILIAISRLVHGIHAWHEQGGFREARERVDGGGGELGQTAIMQQPARDVEDTGESSLGGEK